MRSINSPNATMNMLLTTDKEITNLAKEHFCDMLSNENTYAKHRHEVHKVSLKGSL